jgi:tetratricopeptide (TPR) repeat protein
MNSFDLASAIEPNSTLLMAEMARLQLKSAVADEFLKSFRAGDEMPIAEIDLDNDDLLHKQIERHAAQVAERAGYADVRYRYGVLLRSENRTGEAMEQFAKAVEINPTYVQAIIRLGICQQEVGMADEAIETFRRTLELEPTYVDLHYRLGLLYTDRRMFEDAVRHMEIAAEGAPDNEQIRASLALALQNMGLMDKAAATWRSFWMVQQACAR